MTALLLFFLAQNLLAGPKAGTVTTDSVKDTQMQSILKLSAQADAVVREALWVVNQERPARGKTPFGKINRAMQLEINGKITNKGLFSCDRYVVKKNIQSATGYPAEIEVLQKCSTKDLAKLIAHIDLQKPQKYSIVFEAENLSDVLGIGASIFAKKINCEIESNADDMLTQLRCLNWQQDRGNGKIVKLDTFEYAMNDKNILKLRGQVLENLNPVQKIEADVPMQGKIVVTETVMKDPLSEKVKNPEVLKTEAKKSETLKKVAPTVNADLIQQKIKEHHIEQPTVDQGFLDPQTPLPEHKNEMDLNDGGLTSEPEYVEQPESNTNVEAAPAQDAATVPGR